MAATAVTAATAATLMAAFGWAATAASGCLSRLLFSLMLTSLISEPSPAATAELVSVGVKAPEELAALVALAALVELALAALVAMAAPEQLASELTELQVVTVSRVVQASRTQVSGLAATAEPGSRSARAAAGAATSSLTTAERSPAATPA